MARIDAEIQRAVAKIIGEDVKDPRMGFVTVTRVAISSDMMTCKVFVSIIGDRHVARQSMDALESVMVRNHQESPWVRDSEVEDSKLSLQIKDAGFSTKISARARANVGPMTTLRGLHSQQVKWNYGGIDLLWPGQRGDNADQDENGQPGHAVGDPAHGQDPDGRREDGQDDQDPAHQDDLVVRAERADGEVLDRRGSEVDGQLPDGHDRRAAGADQAGDQLGDAQGQPACENSGGRAAGKPARRAIVRGHSGNS